MSIAARFQNLYVTHKCGINDISSGVVKHHTRESIEHLLPLMVLYGLSRKITEQLSFCILLPRT